MSGNRLGAAERRERDAAEAVANNGGTTRVGGVTGKGFQPGQSGNPSGRPKGIAAVVKSRVKPEELVDILLEIAQDSRSKPAERTQAVKELLDRGYGKSPAFAAIEGQDPLELGPIAQEIQGIEDELQARREGRPSAAPAQDAHG